MKNKNNIVRCSNCGAIYDKTLKWSRGYYQGETSDYFVITGKLKECACPVCLKERK
jgi:rubredoxin